MRKRQREASVVATNRISGSQRIPIAREFDGVWDDSRPREVLSLIDVVVESNPYDVNDPESTADRGE